MNDIEIKTKIHAPDIEPKFRHKQIMETFEGLNSGEYLELSNDHDSKPLHYQFMMEQEDKFSWEYVENGPDLWRVIIGKK